MELATAVRHENAAVVMAAGPPTPSATSPAVIRLHALRQNGRGARPLRRKGASSGFPLVYSRGVADADGELMPENATPGSVLMVVSDEPSTATNISKFGPFCTE
jgi:hypothetical protein